MFLRIHVLNTYTYIGPPKIAHISHDTISLEGNKSKLICIATNDDDSDQSLKIQWYYPSGIRIKSDESRILIYNSPGKDTGQLKSQLLFDPVNRTENGVYTCRAFNDPNCYTEKNVKLTVECEYNIMHIVPLGVAIYCTY